jgi:hypothetical protein
MVMSDWVVWIIAGACLLYLGFLVVAWFYLAIGVMAGSWTDEIEHPVRRRDVVVAHVIFIVPVAIALALAAAVIGERWVDGV